MPFRAVSSYKDTFKTGANRPRTGQSGVSGRGANGYATHGGANGRANGYAANGQNHGANARRAQSNTKGADQIPGGAKRHQKSQISILSSPDKKMPFMKDTTNRLEFRGQAPIERSRPIKHPDNLGNVDLHVDPKMLVTSYRTSYNDFPYEELTREV